jgi:hypothetical protein
MGITEKISVLLEAEVEKKTHEQLCKIVEKVSKLYSIPLKIARRDLLDSDVYCMGVRKNKKLCTNKSVKDGFCMFHLNDPRPPNPIEMVEAVRHNHHFPSPPVVGCPACDIVAAKKRRISSNEYRDLSGIM